MRWTRRRSRCCRSSRTCSRRCLAPARATDARRAHMTKFNASLAVAAAVALLAACGGGGGGSDTPPVQADPLDALPVEATQTVSAWVGFLDRLTKAPGADVREGFGVSSNGVNSVPGDDVADPTALLP